MPNGELENMLKGAQSAHWVAGDGYDGELENMLYEELVTSSNWLDILIGWLEMHSMGA